MVIAVVPFALAVIGALVWAFASNGKVSEMGKWVFIIGTFYLVGSLAHATWRLG